MTNLDINTAQVNGLLIEECQKKEFVIDSGQPCPPTGESIDLVILSDTSGSMADEAAKLSNVIEDAINAAKKRCPSKAEKARIKWFGIEGIWVGTNFTPSYRDYLNGLEGAPFLLEGRPGNKEDGAPAIQDIANFFDWTDGASRVILFLGDEALFGGNPHNPDDVDAANKAIKAANAANVTVHMYGGTGISDEVADEYERVAKETGGEFHRWKSVNPYDFFKPLLEEVICSTPEVCELAEIPKLLPCFKLHWGDGPKDMIETTDTECMCLTACNRYSNVTFKGLTVVISEITKADGTPVPDLPDGTPSVFVKPSRFICFGDLPPCNPNANKPDRLSCVSRELVLVSRGAMEGKYLLNIKYYYSVHLDFKGADQFKLLLTAS
jgi:hypothetical protein